MKPGKNGLVVSENEPRNRHLIGFSQHHPLFTFSGPKLEMLNQAEKGVQIWL